MDVLKGCNAGTATFLTVAAVVVNGNLPFTQWAGAFADDQTLTVTMLGRSLHHAHIVQITGESDRINDKRKTGGASAGALMHD